MDFFVKKGVSGGAIDTIVGGEAFFKGEIKAKGPLRICGELEGSIEAEGEVFLGEKSRVKGHISGGKVVVSGEVFGNITARDGLEILKTGRVHGDITADRLVMEEGTLYQGRVRVGAVSEEPMIAQPAKQASAHSSATAHIFNLFSSGQEEEKLEMA